MSDFEDFCGRLERHDWQHEFSDDTRVYTGGLLNKALLKERARDHALLQKAYDLYESNAIAGTPYNRSELRLKVNELKAELLISC